MQLNKHATGIIVIAKGDTNGCEICVKNKMARKPLRKSNRNKDKVVEIGSKISTDLAESTHPIAKSGNFNVAS